MSSVGLGNVESAGAHARLQATAGSILLLAAMAAIGQFAANVYTPSLPAVALDLGIGDPAAQATLAVFLAAFAVAQLAFGPLADRIGRKSTLYLGMSLFLAGTLACALADALAVMIAGRVVQGAGAAAGLVVSRAATRDSFDGPMLAKALAAVTIAFALVPGLTPLFGGVVEQTLGWRASFWATLAAGVILLWVAAARLPETLPAPRKVRLAKVVSGYAEILTNRVFWPNVLAVGLAFGSLSAFFAGAPAVLITELGISPVEYGFYPPIAVTGFIIGGIVTRRIAGNAAPRDITLLGVSIMLAGAALLFGPPALGLLDKFAINGAMVIHVTGLGILLPAAIAAALQGFPDRAGSAAALQGFVQMMGGATGAGAAALAIPLLGSLAFPTVMLVATALAWLTVMLRVPGKGETE